MDGLDHLGGHEEEPEEDADALALAKGKSKGKGFKGDCFNCGKTGHRAVDCWAKICTLLTWLLPTKSGKKPTIARLVIPIQQFRATVLQVNEFWKRNVAPNCPVSAWVAWADAIASSAVVGESLGYSVENSAIAN